MQMRLARFVLPGALAVLAAFSGPSASAQIRIGVDLPSIHIRVAPDAPPPVRHEVRMRRPGRNHVWIAGYWDREDDRWVWAPGRWERPGHRGSSWVKARYHREGDAYRYEPGHWSHQRMEEGDDYRRWRKERGHGQENRPGHDKDR